MPRTYMLFGPGVSWPGSRCATLASFSRSHEESRRSATTPAAAKNAPTTATTTRSPIAESLSRFDTVIRATSRLEPKEREARPLDPLDRRLGTRVQPVPVERWLGERGRHRPTDVGPDPVDPRSRDLVGKLHVTHLGEVCCPGTRHDRRPLVAAAAGRDPSPLRHLVRERVELGRGLPVGVRRQKELGQRVGAVCVAAELRDQHLGTEGADDGRHDLAEGREPASVRDAGSERHVDLRPQGGTRTAFLHEPGPREQGLPGLMERDRQHARLGVEDRLHPVAVMDVHVHVRDRVHASIEQPRDRDRWVVVHTEARCARRHRVMQPARRVERVPNRSVADGPGRDQRRARDERARLVHVREDRVVAGAVAEPAPGSGLVVPGPPRRVDEGLGVHELDLAVLGGPARQRGHVRRVEEAAGLDQRPRVEDPLRPEWVLWAVVVDARLGTDDETGRAGHACAETAAIAAAVRSTARSHSSSAITNGGPSISRSPSPSTCPVLEYSRRPLSRAAARTRSVTWSERGKGAFERRSATSSIPIISPIPRTSPTIGSSCSAEVRPFSRRSPCRELASTRSPSSSRRSAACATAAATPLWDQVNPCTNPWSRTVSNTSPEHAANPNGRYPLVEPLPAVSTSGRTPQWSIPNHRPVRPNPVITSSAIRSTPWRRQTSATAGQ